MAELLYMFLERNNLMIKINEVKYNGEKYYSFQIVRRSYSDDENNKTPILLLQYNEKPTPNKFVRDIIAEFNEGKLDNSFRSSMIEFLGEEEFNKFLEIVYDEDNDYDSIVPLKEKILLEISSGNQKESFSSYVCNSFFEVKYILNDPYIQKVYIEGAVINDASFFRNYYDYMEEIKFVDCEIRSLDYFPSFNSFSNNTDIIFYRCKISGFTEKQPFGIRTISLKNCIVIVKSKRDSNFLSSANSIKLIGKEIIRLDYIFPREVNAKSIKIYGTSIKSLFGFPQAPKLESLIIKENDSLVTLNGGPNTLESLKKLYLSSNMYLRSFDNFPSTPQLNFLDVSRSKFTKGRLRNIDRVTELDVSYNDPEILLFFSSCYFVTKITANHMKSLIPADIFNKFYALRELTAKGTPIKFTPSIRIDTFLRLSKLKEEKCEFNVHGSYYLQHLFEHAYDTHPITNDDFIDAYSYCTGNLLKAVIEFLRNPRSKWSKAYIENEYDPEYYYHAIEYLLDYDDEKNELAKSLIKKLRKKYKKEDIMVNNICL